MPDTRIAHIDLTAFFVSVERVVNPDLIGKPVMVAGSPGSRGVVTCASYEVRPYGIRAGMPTAVAERKCPHAIRIDGHFELYEEFSHKVRSFLKNYAPVFEPASIDEFYIDWTGCERLFKSSLFNFAKKIQRSIKINFGLPCSIGIGSNKVVAKIACDQAKPSGVVEVKTGDERNFLRSLPVGVLSGVGEVMLEKLNLRGIRTCGQLAEMNSEYIGRTFGKWGLHIQDSARGHGPDRLTTWREQKQISTEETFDTDTRDKIFLHTTLHNMVLRISQELRHMDLKAQCIRLKLRYSDWVEYTRQTTVFPSHDPVFIYQTVLRLFEKADSRRVTIRLIGIGLSKFCEDASTIDLLRQNEERRDWLLKVVDKINFKYDEKLVRIGSGV